MFHFWSIHEKILNPVRWQFFLQERRFLLIVPISIGNKRRATTSSIDGISTKRL